MDNMESPENKIIKMMDQVIKENRGETIKATLKSFNPETQQYELQEVDLSLSQGRTGMPDGFWYEIDQLNKKL